MDKESSDEKLLKLIENAPDIKRPQKTGVRQKKLFPAGFNFRSLLALKIKLNLYILNKGLFVISILLTLYFLYGLFSGISLSRSDLLFPSAEVSPAVSKLITPPKTQPLNSQDYLNEINRRNIFLPAGQIPVSPGERSKQKDTEDLFKDLKLVGIIWSSEPEVIIESKKESRTYSLKKSETFGPEQFRVKDITRNSAVLEIGVEEGAQEYELR